MAYSDLSSSPLHVPVFLSGLGVFLGEEADEVDLDLDFLGGGVLGEALEGVGESSRLTGMVGCCFGYGGDENGSY